MMSLLNLAELEIVLINKNKSTEKSSKKSLIDDLSIILSEIKFEKNDSIKSKTLEYIVKKYDQSVKNKDILFEAQ